ncbi:Gfo/Idh/MocA family protein [Tsukamurella strandjordii]|uniref:Gfo/Idh/MocA family oxidoreductase n=1 Tax=Tsukamurella strandjordii TaxID=147577 RepID=A0AA90NBH7_9ACTN|nr:Gfo/Idh/MocA family oxidoreductase [Tsukamurella strandjordii]MDP0398665.1 Gfo/Idh/MocA family oxidoreductase [Tsukamurella strandjordii]
MTENGIGVAVIGAGMAGKAHAAGYRTASTVYGTELPPVRLVAVADAHEPLAKETARRYGYRRYTTDWRTIADDPAIDAVSVVVANRLHREIVETLLASGKHVLCEKPLSDTMTDAEAMTAAAESSSALGRIGLTYLRSPGVAFLGDLVRSGRLGPLIAFDGAYWTDYACDPQAPISWRFKGPAGSGALADVGSHLTYIAELFGGPVATVRGGTLTTAFTSRPKPLGRVVGHEHAEVSTERELVENDDAAGFFVEFAGGGTGALQVSRVAAGHANTLKFEVFCARGSASFDFRDPGRVRLCLPEADHAVAGERTITLGPDHPYWRGGLPMDAPGVGIGQNDGFVFQARAFLEEIAGVPAAQALPRNAGFPDGLRTMRLLDAAARSALAGGAEIAVPH